MSYIEPQRMILRPRNDPSETVFCELDVPCWAVVTADHVIATGLTYAAADAMIRQADHSDQGLCLVTVDVAERITEGKQNAGHNQ